MRSIINATEVTPPYKIYIDNGIPDESLPLTTKNKKLVYDSQGNINPKTISVDDSIDNYYISWENDGKIIKYKMGDTNDAIGGQWDNLTYTVYPYTDIVRPSDSIPSGYFGYVLHEVVFFPPPPYPSDWRFKDLQGNLLTQESGYHIFDHVNPPWDNYEQTPEPYSGFDVGCIQWRMTIPRIMGIKIKLTPHWSPEGTSCYSGPVSGGGTYSNALGEPPNVVFEPISWLIDYASYPPIITPAEAGLGFGPWYRIENTHGHDYYQMGIGFAVREVSTIAVSANKRKSPSSLPSIKQRSLPSIKQRRRPSVDGLCGNSIVTVERQDYKFCHLMSYL